MSCSNSFGCGFLSECFFPSGRCVAVGGSCRMEEHSLLSDSPCSWHLCYPMSLFPDNVFISICFICNWDGGLDALTALSEKWQRWLPARERVRETNGTFGGYFLFVTSSTGKKGGREGGVGGCGVGAEGSCGWMYHQITFWDGCVDGARSDKIPRLILQMSSLSDDICCIFMHAPGNNSVECWTSHISWRGNHVLFAAVK